MNSVVSSFNSTLVQLKVLCFTLQTSKKSRFNSTLVQLKVAIYHVVPLLDYGFNSTLVQLKEFKSKCNKNQIL